MSTPKVSVCMVSYNHAPYVGEAISSVLRQTFTDFEFLILEHASTDNSLECIKKFDDPRIKLTVFEKNYHSTYAAKKLFEQVSGKYVALICSDDAWEDTKLAEQVDFLDQHDECAVVFTRIFVLNAQNKKPFLPTQHENIFNVQKNRSKDDWLRFMYNFQNPFCCSSALMRTSAYKECGPYDVRSRNVQDLILWMNMLFRYEAHILERKLTMMRYFENQSNVSATSVDNMVLASNEALLFYEAFFSHIVAEEDFLRIFPNVAGRLRNILKYDLPLALALHGLNGPNKMVEAFALNNVYKLMAVEENRQRYEKLYGFTVLDLYRLAQQADIYGQRVGLKKIMRSIGKKCLQQLKLLEFAKKMLCYK